MVKGWRNNPKWIELYARRDKERIERIFARMTMEFENQQALEAARRLREPRFGAKIA